MRWREICAVSVVATGCAMRESPQAVEIRFVEPQPKTTEELDEESRRVHERAIAAARARSSESEPDETSFRRTTSELDGAALEHATETERDAAAGHSGTEKSDEDDDEDDEENDDDEDDEENDDDEDDADVDGESRSPGIIEQPSGTSEPGTD